MRLITWVCVRTRLIITGKERSPFESTNSLPRVSHRGQRSTSTDTLTLTPTQSLRHIRLSSLVPLGAHPTTTTHATNATPHQTSFQNSEYFFCAGAIGTSLRTRSIERDCAVRVQIVYPCLCVGPRTGDVSECESGPALAPGLGPLPSVPICVTTGTVTVDGSKILRPVSRARRRKSLVASKPQSPVWIWFLTYGGNWQICHFITHHPRALARVAVGVHAVL